jgi:hypothetical protein
MGAIGAMVGQKQPGVLSSLAGHALSRVLVLAASIWIWISRTPCCSIFRTLAAFSPFQPWEMTGRLSLLCLSLGSLPVVFSGPAIPEIQQAQLLVRLYWCHVLLRRSHADLGSVQYAPTNNRDGCNIACQ